MTTSLILVLGASLLWIMLCMRFWWAIDRDNVWQRRFIAIGAGMGGGLIYFIGSMMLDMLQNAPQPPPDGEGVRIRHRASTDPEPVKKSSP